MSALKILELPVARITAETFAPYGELIQPSREGAPVTAVNARLDLGRGVPRFYIMSLESRGLSFRDITRHRRVTQCLGAMGGVEWFLAVAAPADPNDPDERPDPEAIAAFRIPGTVAIKLHRGTWHAGPYFQADRVDFFNLELLDTNVSDHDTCHLDQAYGVEMVIDI